MSSEPIRIVHLIQHLGRGGSERQLYLLLRHLDRRRFEHRVIAFHPSANEVWDGPLRELGVAVEHLPPGCRGVPRRLLHLGRRFRDVRPHVVHSWTAHDNPYAGLLGRLLGVPERWGSLRGSLQAPALQELPWLFRALLWRSVDRLVVNCRALGAELEAAGCSAERIVVLPNCVETVAPAPPADLTAHGIDAETVLVGTVGNLRRIKNHELFVQAMAEVLPKHPAVRAVIVGQPLASEPDYPDQITAEIARRSLTGRVVLTGFRADVPGVIARLAVLCLTSHSEGMPNAVLEAMAAGRPVVATRVGGVPELIRPGWNGYVVDPGDAAGLAHAVDRLLADPTHAAELGANGRRQALADHDCQRLADRLGSLYAETA